MKKIIRIYGMHCKSCELLIKNELEELPGLKVQAISHISGQLRVAGPEVDESAIELVIERLGYSLKESDKQQSSTILAWPRIIIAVIAALILFVILLKVNVMSLIPQQGVTRVIALLMGLVASISTCLAVTGGIVIGYSDTLRTQHPLRTQLVFHLGRISAFVLGGAILGLVGQQLSGSLLFTALLSVVVGLVLVYMALQLLKIVPSITRRGLALPSWLSRGVFALKDEKFAPLVGALTFLLPCGFTQAMQIIAINSGNMRYGALTMGVFALGTMPVLFGLGLGTQYIKDKLTRLNTIIAVLLLSFGGYIIYNSSMLVSVIHQGSDTAPQEQTSLQAHETIQRGYDRYQYTPRVLKLAKNKSYTITVTPSSDGVGCFYSSVLPNAKAVQIKKGETFSFDVNTNGSNKSIRLVCGSMGMEQGQIVFQ